MRYARYLEAFTSASTSLDIREYLILDLGKKYFADDIILKSSLSTHPGELKRVLENLPTAAP